MTVSQFDLSCWPFNFYHLVPLKRLIELIIACILSSITAILNPGKKHGLVSLKTDLQELVTDCERDLAIAKSSAPIRFRKSQHKVTGRLLFVGDAGITT